MKYIALTIGPIVETISLGRKTAEIWAASYLFSSFMKEVINELRKKDDIEFIIPYVEKVEIFSSDDKNIGLFHDRFILKSEYVSLDEVETIIQKHKDSLAKMIANVIKKDTDKVEKYINRYMQTYLVEINREMESPITEISDILNNIELHTPVLESEKDYMRLFLDRDKLIGKHAFNKENLSYKSIPEIAGTALKLQTKNDDDEDIYKPFEKNDNFKQAYKYIAIVHADGDNLSDYIKSQENPSVVSQRLLSFDKEAVKVIKKHDALPIFAGGDDLLFFAPILTEEKTVFDLIEELSELFCEELKSDDVSLSFGVSITYYKYPLYEALEHSRDALFDKAKNLEGKNAVHLNVRKHSGQSFEVTLGKAQKSYMQFKTILDDVLLKGLEIPHAIQHKLYGYMPLLTQISPDRLEATFENIFNEDIHKQKFEKGLEDTRNLIRSLGLKKQQLEKAFSLLSIIKLLRSDR